jgi:hypothetical protein
MLRDMTRKQLRGFAAIAALAAVALVAVPVLGVDQSRSPSTGTVPSGAPPSDAPSSLPASAPASSPGSPAPAATSAAAPTGDGDDQDGKPDKAAKPHGDHGTPEQAVTLSGIVGAASGEGEFTLTVGSIVYQLEAGPPWWWGDANPLAAVAGKRVTITGEQAVGSTDVDVLAIDGKAIRAAGKPPWAGGWKVVGPKHPGWAQWKVDKLAGKGQSHGPNADPQEQPSPSP